MPNLALADLVVPYLLRGENLGPQHAALSALRVVSWETATDDFGVAIRGTCQFNGYLRIPPGSGLRIEAGVDEAAPAFDPAQRDSVFDIRETSVDFELFVPRAGSAIIAAGVGTIAPGGPFDRVRNVLNVWDAPPLDPAPSDYPSSGFTIDLVLKAPTLRPPFLHPAKLDALGMLTPDKSIAEVEITLPRLRFRLSHGNATGDRLRFLIVSAGVAGLDDPGDTGVAELISMKPPYAYIGDADDRVVGIGFRSATLDLSDESTPPAILAKAQVGDDWTGLYLPEARIFLSPEGVRDFAFEAGVNELLIGFGPAGGLWGDFEAMLVNQGSGALRLSVRFIDPEGRSYGIERTDATHAQARIPARTRMVVDVSGGRTPYLRRVKVGTAAEDTGNAFLIDMTGEPSQDIVINVSDGSGTPLAATLTIKAERRSATQALPAPGTPAQPPLVATLSAPADSPVLVIASQTDTEVLVTTAPPDSSLLWRIDGGVEVGPQVSIAVPLAPAQTRTVSARRPGIAVPSTLDFYFYFDEPPVAVPAAEDSLLGAYGRQGSNLSTVRAVSKVDRRRSAGHQDPMVAFRAYFDLAPALSTLRIRGEASYENVETDTIKRYNYLLARRRAITVRERIRGEYGGKNFTFDVQEPAQPTPPTAVIDQWATDSGWTLHGGPDDNSWWKATVTLPPGLVTADDEAQGTLQRPAAPPVPVDIVPVDPEPEPPKTPDWFRYVKARVRIVRNELIALEMEGEIDVQTATEQKLQATGQLGAAASPRGRTLQKGAPVPRGPDNPADGITKFRLLCQADKAVGRITTLMSVGADPADKDGLIAFGWIPGEPVPAAKDFGLTLLGSYLSFWPLLVNGAKTGSAEVVDALLDTAALEVPAAVALLPWFRVERIIVFGAEYLQRDRGPEFEGNLLFDIGIDWSANLLDIVIIDPEHPLSVRYRAIGLRFGNREDDGTAQFVLRPVFDSARGYTIDVASGGALKIADPLGQILRVLGARLSRSNPMSFEIDIGLGVDLGVVSVDRASLRVFLDEPRAPELTALAASVDIPGALVGSGYVQIGKTAGPGGQDIAVIAGQIDLTLRPISLRVAAAVEIATIPAEGGRPEATGVYVGLNVVLPVGLPLANSGLGIFGFRGIFGMHYTRNASIGAGSGVPALAWLEAAGGQPHLLVNSSHVRLWQPQIDRWAFGLGMLIGTMEGGIIMNLDGTLLLELPGPRVLIMMNARIVSPPPSLDKLGGAGGVLAVIEVTPEHFMVGILIAWDIERLIKIVIPVEAAFPFPPNLHKWHIYLGARKDIGRPVEVDVLGIVRGTGYLMFKGDGFPAYTAGRATLPAIRGFGIGLGTAASFTWGNTDIGLYLRVGGGMDAVVGFDPFVLAGTIYVSGELRLFILSIGADAQLTVTVNEQVDGDLSLYIHGQACGHVSLLFFDIEGCVDITIFDPVDPAPMPRLVEKVSIKSRSPALLAGTGVDRGIDASLGDALAQDALPAFDDARLPVVPIDAIPVISFRLPAAADIAIGGLGTVVPHAPGLPADRLAERGGEKYGYTIKALSLERIDPASGAVAGPPVQGGTAPATWWTIKDTTEPSPTAQLALFTWEPAPATKALEKTDRLEETIRERWGTVCTDAAPPAEVLWTFRWEPLGVSDHGWDLEATAWPDPPGTRRASLPDTTLHVWERWRSGDASLDMLRGIFPAIVIGGLVPCYAKPAIRPLARPTLRGTALAHEDPVRAAFARRDDGVAPHITPALHAKVQAELAAGAATPGFTLAELTRRLQHGEPIGRRDVMEVLGPVGAARDYVDTTAAMVTNTVPRQCEVRVLEAPMLDDGRVIVVGDEARSAEVEKRLADAGVSRGALDDVVVLDIGGFVELHLLLFVRRNLAANGRVVVRAVNAADQELDRHVVSTTDFTPPRPLPRRWTDPAGPWADDIAELLTWKGKESWPAVLVRLDKQPEAACVEIGVLPGGPRWPNVRADGLAAVVTPQLDPAYYVGAIGATRLGEVLRGDRDQSQIDHDREVITQMFGPTASDNALLHANALYRLTVQWHGRRQRDGQTAGSDAAPEAQTFWFRTESIALPTADTATFTSHPPVPVRLDPWMLVTLPADQEQAYFGEERVRLVFNTHDVDRVFATYGKELRVRFAAASGRHPPSNPPLGILNPFPINGGTLIPVKATVLSPWEDAAGAVLAGSCVPIDEDRVRHSLVDIPIPLVPYTDYLMDVELVDAAAAETARGPRIYRRHFSTGGYPTFESFGAALLAERPRARFCEPLAMEAIRAYFNGRDPQGSELDAQLMAHGIEPLPVPTQPRIVVFWSQQGADPPQPAAVLVDASEPLWRRRPYPAKVVDDSGPQTAERWVLQDTEFMQLQDASDHGVVAASGILRAPGMQRALVVLAASARGKTIKLDLVELAFPALPFLNQSERRVTLIELPLAHAPWEEV